MLKRNKILLVEDEPAVAKLFQFTLGKEGFEVVLAANGKEGFDLIKKHHFDLILSDIMMPEIDGYEFRKLVLNEKTLKNIPFVFLTAKGSDEDILSGYDMEIDEYIIKTSPPKIVIAKLRAILSSKNKRENEVVEELNQAVNSMGSRVVSDTFPEFPGYDIKHWHQPFKNIPGGDFIDYIKIDDEHLLIVLGDVMGKKWNAWYFAFAYAGYVRSCVRAATESFKDVSPAKIVEQVNKTVFHDERISEIFTTISILAVNKSTNIVYYAGAGDLPLFLKRAATNEIEKIKSTGLLLGFSEESDYQDVKIEMNSGDKLYLYTDGIIEAENLEGEFYGLENFTDLILQEPAEEISFDFIKENLQKFTQSDFSDDLSLVRIQKTN